MPNPSIVQDKHNVNQAGGSSILPRLASNNNPLPLRPAASDPAVHATLLSSPEPPADPEVYKAALKLVRYIDRTQEAGSRHYRTRAGLLLLGLNDVIDAILVGELVWPMSLDHISDTQRCLTAPIVDSDHIEHPGPRAEALAYCADELRAVVDAWPEGYRQLHVQWSSSKSHGYGMASDTEQIVKDALNMASSVLPGSGVVRIRYDLQLGQVREVETPEVGDE